jgi:hypothetical protein
MVADSCRSRSSVRERASRHGLVSCSREAKASSRRITSRRSGDRNAFSRRQGQALHPERKPLERIDGIRRTLGESTSLLQLIETNSDATRFLCPDCASRRPAGPPRVARNQEFESTPLQRRVIELSVPQRQTPEGAGFRLIASRLRSSCDCCGRSRVRRRVVAGAKIPH